MLYQRTDLGALDLKQNTLVSALCRQQDASTA